MARSPKSFTKHLFANSGRGRARRVSTYDIVLMQITKESLPSGNFAGRCLYWSLVRIITSTVTAPGFRSRYPLSLSSRPKSYRLRLYCYTFIGAYRRSDEGNSFRTLRATIDLRHYLDNLVPRIKFSTFLHFKRSSQLRTIRFL